jgi:hypothetical protein
MDSAMKMHDWKIEEDQHWTRAPFSIYAEGLQILRSLKKPQVKNQSEVRKTMMKAEKLFIDVLELGISDLEEQMAGRSEETERALEFMKNPSNIQSILEEWVTGRRYRIQWNSRGHPFSTTSPQAVRDEATKLFKDCLNHQSTEGFRNVAILTQLKLEAKEKEIKSSTKSVLTKEELEETYFF